MIKIFAFNIEENANQINISQLMKYVAVEKQERINHSRGQADVQRTLLADALIRAVACRHLQRTNHELQFKMNEYGKPFLDGADKFYFNLSHSGKWVVCAADNQAIGIDIEEIAPVEMDIAKLYFSAEEFAYLMAKNQADRLPLFYDLWTLKESYIKALGCGLNVDLNAFTVAINYGQAEIKKTFSQMPAFLRQYPLDIEYRLSVCAFNNEFPDEIEIVDMAWILDGIIKRPGA